MKDGVNTRSSDEIHLQLTSGALENLIYASMKWTHAGFELFVN